MARKELTIEQENEIRLNRLFRTKHINPNRSNVQYLKRISALCRGVAKHRRGAHKRLNNALINGMPYVWVQLSLQPRVAAAMRSACNQLAMCRNWEPGEYDMWAMLIGDAADHLNVARAIDEGASAERVQNMLWNMDTASREQMHDKVWNWLDKEVA